MGEMTQSQKQTNTRNLMSDFDKHVLAFSPTHIRFGPIQQFKDYRLLEK